MANPKPKRGFVTRSKSSNNYEARMKNFMQDKTYNPSQNLAEREAVKNFQIAYNKHLKDNKISKPLLSVDGIVGPKTYAAMFPIEQPKVSQPVTPAQPLTPQEVYKEVIPTTTPAATPIIVDNKGNTVKADNVKIETGNPQPVVSSDIPLSNSTQGFAQLTPKTYVSSQLPITNNHYNNRRPGFFPGLGLFAKKDNGNTNNYQSNNAGVNNESDSSNRRRLFEYDRNSNEASMNLEAIPKIILRDRQGNVVRPFGNLRDKISQRNQNREIERNNIQQAIEARLNGQETEYTPQSKKEARKYKRAFENEIQTRQNNVQEQQELSAYNQKIQNQMNQTLDAYKNPPKALVPRPEPTQWDNNPHHTDIIKARLDEAVNFNDMSNKAQAEYIDEVYKLESERKEGGNVIETHQVLPKAQNGLNKFGTPEYGLNLNKPVQIKSPTAQEKMNIGLYGNQEGFHYGQNNGNVTRMQFTKPYNNDGSRIKQGLEVWSGNKLKEDLNKETSRNENGNEFNYDPTRLTYYGNRMQANANLLPVLYNTSKALFDKPEVQRPFYNNQDQATLAGLRNNKINANMNPINTGRVVAMDAIRNNARGSGSLMSNLIAANANANKQMNDESYRVASANQAQDNTYLEKLHSVGTNRQLENKYTDEANRKHRLAMEEFRRDAIKSGEKAMINKGQLLNSELSNQMKLEGYLNQLGQDYKFQQDNNGNLKIILRNADGTSRTMNAGMGGQDLINNLKAKGASYNEEPSKNNGNTVRLDANGNPVSHKKYGGKVYKRRFLI